MSPIPLRHQRTLCLLHYRPITLSANRLQFCCAGVVEPPPAGYRHGFQVRDIEDGAATDGEEEDDFESPAAERAADGISFDEGLCCAYGIGVEFAGF